MVVARHLRIKPPELQTKLGMIANVEDDTLSGLLIEGAARVLQDRQSDPDFPAQVEAHLAHIGSVMAELTLESDALKQGE